MNTYRIYEQLREPLGDAAAKALTETLSGMMEELRDSVTKEDFRILRESIDANVTRLDSSLERLADAQAATEAGVGRLDAAMAKLIEAQARTDSKMAELVEAQGRSEAGISRLDAAMAKLAEAQARTDSKMAELVEAQSRSEAGISRLDAAIAKLTEAQARTDSKMAELVEAQGRSEAGISRLDAAMAKLTEAQARTDSKMAELVEAQGRSEASINRLDAAVEKLTEAQTDMASALQRLTIRTDDVVGRTFELQFRDRLTAYLGRFLRRGRIVPNDQLLEEIEPHLTAREVDQVLRADVIASGTVEGEPTYVVVEVSWTGDTEDVVRADERAKLLRRAGLAALPLVACNAISPESTAMAKLRQVRVWCNGSLLEAAA